MSKIAKVMMWGKIRWQVTLGCYLSITELSDLRLQISVLSLVNM
jgi:hypothetical protein